MKTLNYLIYGSVILLILIIYIYLPKSALENYAEQKRPKQTKPSTPTSATLTAKPSPVTPTVATPAPTTPTLATPTATPALATPTLATLTATPTAMPAPATPTPPTSRPETTPTTRPVSTPTPTPPATSRPVSTSTPAPTPTPTPAPVPTVPIVTPMPTPVNPVAPSQLPMFMDPNRLLLPFTDQELFEYKVFHVTIISCVIKQAINQKMYDKKVSFKQIYRETLQRMGIESRIFERNLDGYINAILTQSDRTWKEVFDSKRFLDAVTENIRYFIRNPVQSKLNATNVPVGTIENVRKPILNEGVFVVFYNKCQNRIKSLEFASPISFTRNLYD